MLLLWTFPYKIQSDDTLLSLAEKYNTTVEAISIMNSGIDINSLQTGQFIYICPGLGSYPQTMTLLT